MLKRTFGIFAVLVFAVGLFGCGGSKGSGGQAEPKPAQITNATGETVGAVVGDLVGEFSTGVMELGESMSQPKLKKSRLGRIVKPLIARKKGLIDFPSECGNALTVEGTQSQDKKTIIITEVYNNCVEKFGFNQQEQCPSDSQCSKITYNGRIVSEFTNPDWATAIPDPTDPPDDFINGVNKIKGTYTDFKDVWELYHGTQIKEKDEIITNGSVVINFNFESETKAFSVNIVSQFKEEEMSPEYELTTGTTNYNIGMVIEDKIENNNEIEQATINGGVTLKITKPVNKTESLSFTNYIIKEWDVTSPVPGTMATVSGRMTLGLSCISGKVTVATQQAIFTPIGEWCPTSGKITISGSGTATIEHTSTGGIKVYVNDNLVKAYDSCEELKLCDGESIFAGITPLYENRKLMIAKSQGCRWNKS